MDTKTRQDAVGRSLNRVDGNAKVTGQATYAGDFTLPGMLHARLVLSTISAGRITRLDTTAAQALPGVRAILSHESAPRLAYKPMEPRPTIDPAWGEQLRVFQSPEILFSGQPIAAVIAESPETANEAAALVQPSYEIGAARTDFDLHAAQAPHEASAKAGFPEETQRGDPDVGLQTSAVRIEASYAQHREQHNPIELPATLASWDGARLTLYDKSQWVQNVRREIAHIFGISENQVRVVCPFVGGAFGAALRTWPHVTVAALAAKVTGHPVRLELSRQQANVLTGYRPYTEQRVRIGADAGGRILAIDHQAVAQTSRYEEYVENTVKPAQITYACPNVHTRYRVVPINVSTPASMRAPGMSTGLLALETAVDELAAALELDPLQLRLKNIPERDQKKDLPWSNNEVEACYLQGAAQFGWDRRIPEPRSMRANGEFVGYGMASALYPAARERTQGEATLRADGSAVVRSATSDMGSGTATAMSQIAADALALPVDLVRFKLGDSDMPQAPEHAGSITLSSVGPAVQAACLALQRDLYSRLQSAHPSWTNKPATWREGGLIVGLKDRPIRYPELLGELGLSDLTARADVAAESGADAYSACSFGAVFAEVRVDPELGVVRVSRLLGAYDIGRVVNPKLARSQAVGGLIAGIGMALLEQANWDTRTGRLMNADLAEYLVPVCADAGSVDCLFVPSHEPTFTKTRRQKRSAARADRGRPGHWECCFPCHRQAYTQFPDPSGQSPGPLGEQNGLPQVSRRNAVEINHVSDRHPVGAVKAGDLKVVDGAIVGWRVADLDAIQK